MTDTFALTGRPLNTAIAWCDKDSIYVEYPTKGGPPYICKYSKNLASLQFAFNILAENPTAETRQIERNHPAVQKAKPTVGTAEQREQAAAVVRRLFK